MLSNYPASYWIEFDEYHRCYAGPQAADQQPHLDWITDTSWWGTVPQNLLPNRLTYKITLLRVIPTMTFIHCVTGKSSGILSDISSGILSGISSGILPGISSGILSTQIFWHSIWQTFWHFIWHIFWHSIWHIFWHIIYSNLLAFYLANILALYLAYLLAFYLAYLLTFYLAYLLALYLAYLMAFYLAYLLAFYLAYLLAFCLAFEVQRCALSSEGPRLRSSGAHWARQVPGWGPAVRTELGRSQVEVQRCAHWAGKVPGWGPAVRTELGRSQVEAQQCALSSEVGEELGEELARRKWRWKQTWSRRNWRRRRRRRRSRRRTTALLKSNNPHLAGGESICKGGSAYFQTHPHHILWWYIPHTGTYISIPYIPRLKYCLFHPHVSQRSEIPIISHHPLFCFRQSIELQLRPGESVSSWGYPQLSIYWWMFHEINHPWGVSYLLKPPYILYIELI